MTEPNDPPKPPTPKKPEKDKDGGTGTAILERSKLQRPSLWRVVMHNDDYTTQEFVVHVLQVFFRKDPTEAHHLMLKVHMTGKAIVAVYPKDIAETKVQQVTDYAQEMSHPLMVTLEPDE
ncbi:MAG: ATP-dependent Clp protease adaptor ClpS [Deltaproteobacteria bacterium]|nr:ATP-dependent Clp protease adaptor ClpS [Deltaproteobacteria bacterium]